MGALTRTTGTIEEVSTSVLFSEQSEVPAPAPSRVTSSIRGRLSSLARTRGSDTAVVNARSLVEVSWEEVDRQVASWTSEFAPGTAVGLVAGDPENFAGAYLAALSAGVCVAPLDSRATREELAATADLLGIADLVVDESGYDVADGLGANLKLLTPGRLISGTTSRSSRTGPRGASSLMTTSGTTGRRKIVPLSEGHLLEAAARIVRHHEIGALDRGYNPLPLCHINGQVVGLVSNLVAGSTLVLDDRFHRRDLWDAVDDLGVTWLNLVPAIFAALSSEAPPSDRVGRTVRFARSASAPLPLRVLETFEARTGIGILETYGMTEAASQIIANPICESERRPGSVGRPVGVQVRVVGESDERLSDGEIGNVEIRGKGVVDSYLGEHGSAVPAKDADGWFRTGDLGWRDPDDFIHLEGRVDDMINRGGEKIRPREVEDVLRRYDGVADVAVVGRPHPLLGSEVIACVKPRASVAEAEYQEFSERLEGKCRASLSRHKVPAKILIVESLPVSATGKLLRKKLTGLVAGGTMDLRSAS